MSKIKMDQLDASLKGSPLGFPVLDPNGKLAGSTLPASIGEHSANADIHVTAANKLAWSNSITNLVNHINDTIAHITALERTKWNNGQLFRLTQATGATVNTTVRPTGTGTFTFTGSNKGWFPSGDDVHVIYNQATLSRFTLQLFHYLTGATYMAYYDGDTETWSPWTRFTNEFDLNGVQNEVNQLRLDMTQRTIHAVTALLNGATLTGSSNAAYREGTRVYFEILCTLPSGMASGTTLFTLPSGMRPSKLTYMQVSGNNGQTIQISITTGGAVSTNTAITSTTVVTIFNSFALTPVR